MKSVFLALRAALSAADSTGIVLFESRPPTLALRLVLAILPALVGTLTWDWLQDVTGEGYPFGFHPLWIYYWHPPLMDVLFGVLVLASFIETRRRWWLRAAILGLVSFVVHTAAVFVVTNTQGMLAPFFDMRFASVLPVAVVATVVLTSVTAAIARLTTIHLLAYSTLAGLAAGIVFLLALESDTGGYGWFWRNNVHWMFWHASIAAAIHFGSKRRSA